MNQDWLEETLAPQLADVESRSWTAASMAEFVVDLHHQVTSAVEAGLLPPDREKIARERITRAIASIPNVTVSSTAAAATADPARTYPVPVVLPSGDDTAAD